MERQKHGPASGSAGAKRIGEAHKGSKSHDETGGFASNPQLAKAAGKKGGDAVKKKFGPEYYREIGAKGGNALKEQRGSEYYREIGKRGAEVRAQQRRDMKDS